MRAVAAGEEEERPPDDEGERQERQLRPERVEARERARRDEREEPAPQREGGQERGGNEEEIEECVGFPLGDSLDALTRAGEVLRTRIACPHVLVTRGSRGMALFSESDPPKIIPVHGTDQVADVTGAGDTVLATFSLALAAGAAPLEAALLANFAGGVVVMKMGTATVTREELARAIESDREILE